ncbi:MAG: NosD domain-containing protein, partial [Candidatus Undinarchaeales archaeon]
GIYLNSSNNTFTENNISNNNLSGFNLTSNADNNLIYNNYFSNNTINAYDPDGSSTNSWNTSKTSGTNIIGGSFIGGNYWDDYSGGDLNEDGLGDTETPYNSSSGIPSGGDYAPLTTNYYPVITDMKSLSAYDPVPGGTTSIDMWFVVSDLNEVPTLDDSSAEIHFTKAGETARNDTSCSASDLNGTATNYSGTVVMQFYDGSGSWSINVSVKDNDNNFRENTTTSFIYNPLTAMQTNLSEVDFGDTRSIGQQNVPATNDPFGVQNFGNQNITDISVTAIDLQGQTYPSYYIPAENIECDGDDSADDSTALVNNTAVQIIDPYPLYIEKGPSSMQSLYFHLDIPSTDLTSQTYNTTGLGKWTITVSS